MKRTALLIALCAAVAMPADAARFRRVNPAAATPWGAAFAALGNVSVVRTRLEDPDIRQAFVYALQGRVLPPTKALMWRELDAASFPIGNNNVLMVDVGGFSASYGDGDSVYILVSAPSGTHGFVSLPVDTPLTALQTLCDVWTDANYAFNTLLPGPYPHIFGYPPVRCEFSYNQSP